MGLQSQLDGLGVFAAHRHPFQDVLIRMETNHIPVHQSHCRPLDGADRSHCCRLAWLLYLDLGAGSHELAQEQHAGGIDSSGSQARISGPPITQPKASRTGGMREYRPSCNEVAQELGS